MVHRDWIGLEETPWAEPQLPWGRLTLSQPAAGTLAQTNHTMEIEFTGLSCAHQSP